MLGKGNSMKIKVEVELDDLFNYSGNGEHEIEDVEKHIEGRVISEIASRVFAPNRKDVNMRIKNAIDEKIKGEVCKIVDLYLDKKISIKKQYGSEGYEGTLRDYVDLKLGDIMLGKDDDKCGTTNKLLTKVREHVKSAVSSTNRNIEYRLKDIVKNVHEEEIDKTNYYDLIKKIGEQIKSK